MKYLLCVGYFNGGVKYFGPFASSQRAEAYAREHSKDEINVRRWFVTTLTTPVMDYQHEIDIPTRKPVS